MKKKFKVIIALLVAIFAMPVFGSGVFAEEGLQLEDGTYEINYNVIYEGEGRAPDLNNYFKKPAILEIENGTKFLVIEHTSPQLILSIDLPSDNVEIVNANDSDAETRIIKFEVESDLNEPMEFGLNMSYRMTHVVKATFDLNTVTKVDPELVDPESGEDTENTDDVESPVEENDGNQNEETPVNDNTDSKEDDKVNEENNQDSGEKINYVVKHATQDQTSAADMFFKKPATLLNKNGDNYLQLTVTNWGMIDYLKTSNGDVKVIKENSDGSATVEFKISGNLSEAVLLDMQVTVPGVYVGQKHEARLFLEVSNNNDVEKENSNANDKAKEETKEPVKETNKKEETKPEVVKDQLTPDKVYEINYLVKHATQDKASAADQFFKKPAYLLVKNGEKYIQLTVTNSDMIDSLKTAHGDVVIVKKNADGSMVIQFKVTDLSKPVVMDMHITVPGMYSMDHTARLFFDESNMKEIDSENHKLAASTDGSSNGKTVNPQTGDDTNILLYVLLLIGSAIPLAIFAKRRFA